MKGQLAVVIPAFNAATHITETLRSVCAQTIQPDEIILVDDGSTDGTADVAAAVDPRIRVIRQANGGAGAARNTGILASHSRHVAIVDADDLLLENHFALTMTALERHQDAPLAFGDVLEFTDAGFYPHSFWHKTRSNHHAVERNITPHGVTLLGEGLTASLFRGNIVPVSTTVIRRSAFAQAGLFNAALRAVEDQDLNLRLSRLGPFAFVGEVTAHKRVHLQSLTVQADALVWAMEGLRVLSIFRTLHPETVSSGSGALALRFAVHEAASRAFYHASLHGRASLSGVRRVVHELGWRLEPNLRDWLRAAFHKS